VRKSTQLPRFCNTGKSKINCTWSPLILQACGGAFSAPDRVMKLFFAELLGAAVALRRRRNRGEGPPRSGGRGLG